MDRHNLKIRTALVRCWFGQMFMSLFLMTSRSQISISGDRLDFFRFCVWAFFSTCTVCWRQYSKRALCVTLSWVTVTSKLKKLKPRCCSSTAMFAKESTKVEDLVCRFVLCVLGCIRNLWMLPTISAALISPQYVRNSCLQTAEGHGTVRSYAYRSTIYQHRVLPHLFAALIPESFRVRKRPMVSCRHKPHLCTAHAVNARKSGQAKKSFGIQSCERLHALTSNACTRMMSVHRARQGRKVWNKLNSKILPLTSHDS